MGAGVDNRGRVMQCMSIDIATSVSDSVVQATDSILRVYAETDVRLWSLEKSDSEAMGAGVDNRGRVMQCMSIDIATSVSDSVVQATDSILRVYAETDVRLWSLEKSDSEAMGAGVAIPAGMVEYFGALQGDFIKVEGTAEITNVKTV